MGQGAKEDSQLCVMSQLPAAQVMGDIINLGDQEVISELEKWKQSLNKII